jgi:hypothetical protein
MDKKNSKTQSNNANARPDVSVGLSPDSVLESIDRELDFYRKRAGQVFFFGLLAEILILAGKERILLGDRWPALRPALYTLMFGLVAYTGYRLGNEYKVRIHTLKHSRRNLLEDQNYKTEYPIGRDLSEIKFINFILVSLSIIGSILVWLTYVSRGYESLPK